MRKKIVKFFRAFGATYHLGLVFLKVARKKRIFCRNLVVGSHVFLISGAYMLIFADKMWF